jgi:hypothetical protein
MPASMIETDHCLAVCSSAAAEVTDSAGRSMVYDGSRVEVAVMGATKESEVVQSRI